LRLLPQFRNSGTWAVSGLLSLGLLLLLLMRHRRRQGESPVVSVSDLRD